MVKLFGPFVIQKNVENCELVLSEVAGSISNIQETEEIER